MALTRKALKAMGIEEEKIEQIIDAHTETVDALKEERDRYKADAEQLVTVQKELNDLKKDGGDWQAKYEKEHSDFEAYKNDQTAKESRTAKIEAYKALLADAGVSEKRIPAIVKVTSFDEIELDKDGKIKDADKHKETVRNEYPEFIGETRETGVHTPYPPANGGSGGEMTKEQIMSIKDGSERRKAIAAHLDQFGLQDQK